MCIRDSRYRTEKRVEQQASFGLYWKFQGPRGLSRLIGAANLSHFHHPFGVYFTRMPNSSDVSLLNELNLDDLDVAWGASDQILEFVKSLPKLSEELNGEGEIRRTRPLRSNFSEPLDLLDGE